MFYFLKFIWRGGNDRVKRGGLRMVGVVVFSQTQKMVWTKHLHDPNHSGFLWRPSCFIV